MPAHPAHPSSSRPHSSHTSPRPTTAPSESTSSTAPSTPTEASHLHLLALTCDATTEPKGTDSTTLTTTSRSRTDSGASGALDPVSYRGPRTVNVDVAPYYAADPGVEGLPAGPPTMQRPSECLAGIMGRAILASAVRGLSLEHLYRWIETAYPFFTTPQGGGWRNSVRHTLSIHKMFDKVDRTEAHPMGKGGIWQIVPGEEIHWEEADKFTKTFPAEHPHNQVCKHWNFEQEQKVLDRLRREGKIPDKVVKTQRGKGGRKLSSALAKTMPTTEQGFQHNVTREPLPPRSPKPLRGTADDSPDDRPPSKRQRTVEPYAPLTPRSAPFPSLQSRAESYHNFHPHPQPFSRSHLRSYSHTDTPVDPPRPPSHTRAHSISHAPINARPVSLGYAHPNTHFRPWKYPPVPSHPQLHPHPEVPFAPTVRGEPYGYPPVAGPSSYHGREYSPPPRMRSGPRSPEQSYLPPLMHPPQYESYFPRSPLSAKSVHPSEPHRPSHAPHAPQPPPPAHPLYAPHTQHTPHTLHAPAFHPQPPASPPSSSNTYPYPYPYFLAPKHRTSFERLSTTTTSDADADTDAASPPVSSSRQVSLSNAGSLRVDTRSGTPPQAGVGVEGGESKSMNMSPSSPVVRLRTGLVDIDATAPAPSPAPDLGTHGKLVRPPSPAPSTVPCTDLTPPDLDAELASALAQEAEEEALDASEEEMLARGEEYEKEEEERWTPEERGWEHGRARARAMDVGWDVEGAIALGRERVLRRPIEPKGMCEEGEMERTLEKERKEALEKMKTLKGQKAPLEKVEMENQTVLAKRERERQEAHRKTRMEGQMWSRGSENWVWTRDSRGAHERELEEQERERKRPMMARVRADEVVETGRSAARADIDRRGAFRFWRP